MNKSTLFAVILLLSLLMNLVACQTSPQSRLLCQPIKPVLTSAKKNSDDGISLDKDDTAALMFYITQLQECTGV